MPNSTKHNIATLNSRIDSIEQMEWTPALEAEVDQLVARRDAICGMPYYRWVAKEHAAARVAAARAAKRSYTRKTPARVAEFAAYVNSVLGER